METTNTRTARAPRPPAHLAGHRDAARRALALAFLGALIGSALTGCAAAQRKTEPLAESVRAYNDSVRWLRFDDAATRLPPERRDDFLDERDQLHEDLRITDYEIIRVRHDAKGRRARVQIKYTWYLDSRGKVHETHAVQTWHQGDTVWILRGERFLRGEPMPGLEGGESRPEAQASPEAAPDEPVETQSGSEPELPETDPAPLEEAAGDPPQGS